MGVFQKIKDGLREAIFSEYNEFLSEVFPKNYTTDVTGLRNLTRKDSDWSVMYVIDTGEGMQDGYYTAIYTFKSTFNGEPQCSYQYSTITYNLKKQRWEEELFYNEALWIKVHKNDRLFITSDGHEAKRLVRNYCFPVWKKKRKGK